MIITEDVRAALAMVRALAALKPVRVLSLQKRLNTERGKADHLQQMNEQSVRIPGAFFATFWIEVHRKGALARRVSINAETPGRVPHPAAVWMVAEHLGFVGSIPDRVMWHEPLSNGTLAVHLVQRLSTH